MTTKYVCMLTTAVLLLGGVGCATDSDPAVTRGTASNPSTAASSPVAAPSECTPLIRLGGVVYLAYGHTKVRPTPFGEAEVAACEDTVPDSRGSFFPTTPQTEPVGTFDGYDSADVLALRLNRQLFTVFIAESVPRARGDRIFAALG
jgi:hypothetical protein